MAQCYWYGFIQYVLLWYLLQLMFKHLINSQSRICPPPPGLLTTKTRSALQIYPCKASPYTALLNCLENNMEPRITVQILTFRNSLCTAPITLRRAVQGCPPPFIISSFLKDFFSSVRLLRYFPEDCCWIDWALIAQPCQAQGGISPSLLPLLPAALQSCCSSVTSEKQRLAIH